MWLTPVSFTAAAAENGRVEETKIDEPQPEPTAGLAATQDLYLVANPQNRTSDHVYKQLNVNKNDKTSSRKSGIYVNWPRPIFSRRNRGTAEDNKNHHLYANV